MVSKMYQSSPAVTYKVCKIQGEIEDFLDSGEDQREIFIGERELASVRGSFTQAIKRMHRRAKMVQKDGHLYITKE